MGDNKKSRNVFALAMIVMFVCVYPFIAVQYGTEVATNHNYRNDRPAETRTLGLVDVMVIPAFVFLFFFAFIDVLLVLIEGGVNGKRVGDIQP